MTAKQQVFRVRRSYNQWVNNQTLEDYALRFTAKGSRRWSLARVANTALGAISFLALEAIGAAITLSYGFENALAAVLVVGTIIFCAGLPICYYAAKYGIDIDLLTRGASFGYIGSTATSLIYASFTFIFFALEAAIMAKAMELILGIPLAAGYVISSVVVIPLVFYGITFISRFQLWTQPFWVFLQLLPFGFILFNDASLLNEWQEYQGKKQNSPGIDILLFGAAASVMFSLVAQIGEQVDFLRFLPEKTAKNRFAWWSALVLAGPGWVIVGCIKILIGSFLAIVAINQGADLIDAQDPTTMYSAAFNFVTENKHLSLILAGIFVVISQLKINVTNAYAGSIAWSNFFSRLTHDHPGRVVWLVFNVAIALLLMELGIYHAFESTLSIYAIVAVSWVGALVADLVLNKPLGFSPKHIEFKRAYLYDVNPVGVVSMLSASVLGIVAYLGFFGIYGQALAHFIALTSSFFISPIVAWLTKGRYYIARQPFEFSDKTESITCSVCQNHYESDDMAYCPAYEGSICSLCCSLDSRCQDVCKPSSNTEKKLIDFVQKYLPRFVAEYVNSRLVHFALLLVLVALVIGILLTLIYSNIQTDNALTEALLSDTLWKVFFILMIVSGVICWLFVLAHHSQIVAHEESQTQTRRLEQEIEAHKKTDLALQQSKEKAEAANNAKSRYLTGISHELRSPLNTVLGYAHLIEMNENVDDKIREKISIMKRSGEHLADLIEGLLDISKIEAGRLDIQRNPIRFNSILNQLEQMFHLQAEAKNLKFVYERVTDLPEAVMGDEKRIRQILINLLSNAIKFTEVGEVSLSVKYKNQVAEFRISDTGIGIHEDEYERIFKPFERVRGPGNPVVSGTGLGLTITRLLVDIMGGDIAVAKNEKGGTTFTVWLMLSRVEKPIQEELKPKQIYGYFGKKRSVMVVDDDATHRGLISDLLIPLGFLVVEAPDAEACFDMVKSFEPDIFLVDRRMPGRDGPQLAKILRKIGFFQPILMVTANANEDMMIVDPLNGQHEIKRRSIAYDDYLIKPIKLDYLLERLEKYLNLRWFYTPKNEVESFSEAKNQDPATLRSKIDIEAIHSKNKKLIENAIYYAELGNLNKLKSIGDELQSVESLNPRFVKTFNRYVKEIKFNKIIELFEAAEP